MPSEVAVLRRTAHAPRHAPANNDGDDLRVSRILRDRGRSPATSPGSGVTMFAQRQQLKRKATLANRAHSMRHQPTPSEAKLWGAIAAGQLGAAFKRQVPIGNFIVDFVAPAARLVIEVDGSAHASRAAADRRKDRQLARLGYRVLRLPAELALAQLPVAVARVREALSAKVL